MFVIKQIIVINSTILLPTPKKCSVPCASCPFDWTMCSQCSNSEHDGLITVQSGGNKYLAIVFKEGTIAELHEAQKLLGKAMNTDIESDYNPEQENKMKTKTITIVKQQSKEPTITSLSDIPFGGKAFKNVTNNSQSKNVHSTLGMHKKGAGDNLRHLKQTINNSDSSVCEDLRSSPQRRYSKRTKATNIKSKRQCTSSKSHQITPSSSSISILQTPKLLAGQKILGINDDNE
ncbi:unnamed protein product [Rotaria sordida]|uniref:Uncharacterized protein n=1 Tax=Rotaria sordida TaxID=392033 RepID=A0A814JMN1_9BILA|nr:unnamed protein product [Rotaria sordida]